jgi:hypothetical protein
VIGVSNLIVVKPHVSRWVGCCPAA